MPGKKADLSRLVMLTYTPTEAALLQGALEVMRNRMIAASPAEVLDVLDHSIHRINLQLRQLKWPPQHNKAPFPV